MRPYYKIRSAYDGKLNHKDIYGDVPRYHWTHEAAQRACDDLNAAHYAQKNISLAGTLNVIERFEHNGKLDDNDANDILSGGE